MPDITSRQHHIVHAFKAAARGDSSELLLDGWHLLHDAAAAGVEIRIVAITGAPPTAGDRRLIDDLAGCSRVFTVTQPVMNAMSPVRTPSGVVALAARRSYAVPQLLAPPPALLLVAVGIQDAGNVGAIVRSVEAGGGTGALFLGTSADPWGWKALRASMGSSFRLPLARLGDMRVLDELRTAGLRLVATVPRGGVAMQHIDVRPPTALIVGAEGLGLDDAVLTRAHEHLSIPMRPPVESLNVAVAAALLIYEARRQREA